MARVINSGPPTREFSYRTEFYFYDIPMLFTMSTGYKCYLGLTYDEVVMTYPMSYRECVALENSCTTFRQAQQRPMFIYSVPFELLFEKTAKEWGPTLGHLDPSRIETLMPRHLRANNMYKLR